MKTHCSLVGLFSFCLVLMANAQSVPIVFDLPVGTIYGTGTIQPGDTIANNIWVQFLNTTGVMDGTYRDPLGIEHALQINTPYSLASITSPVSVGGGAPINKAAVNISNFESGRVYINYGTSGLSGLSGSYQPANQAPSDPNYSVRYQYFEPTIVGAQANVDLSYIDFAAIPMSTRAVNSPNATNNPQLTTATGQALMNATANSGLAPNNNVVGSPLPDNSFARVNSPQLMGNLYHDWTSYLQTTLQGKTAELKGLYVGTGTQPGITPTVQRQSYDFIASFAANGDVTLTAQTGSGNGQLPVIPANIQGPGVGDGLPGTGQTISILFSDLNAITGIYGNNPAYTVNDNGAITITTGIVNDVFGRVVGDLMAGLSFGFIGSTVDFNGTPIGDLPSTAWWGGTMPDGSIYVLADTPAGQNDTFGVAQPGNPLNYHTYAASLSGLTSGYGFALQDRLNNNLIAFNTATDPNSYLELIINPDVIPEPGTIGLLLLGVGGLLMLCLRQGQGVVFTTP
ncbi:MAG: beta-1,3-glucanase family protein [Terrimicrobiaceae bacterium]